MNLIPNLKMSRILIVIMVLFLLACSSDNEPIIYKDKTISIEKRVEDLLSRMSLQEKIDQLAGVGFDTKYNARLDIPVLKMTDGPVGVRWGEATALPAAIGLASSWDKDLMYRVGELLGKEAKARGRNFFLGPCVNIHRFPVGGRNFESFGEDPYLAGQIAVPYIKGVQSQNVLACVKHFACNNQEWHRDDVNAIVGERALHEIYFPAFKAAVQDAEVWTVMTSYNKVNGNWTAENDYLLNTTLKEKWGFDGFVVSDWGAAHSTVQSAKSGLDLEMPFGDFYNDSLINKALDENLISTDLIDEKLRRLLRVRFEAAMFDETHIADENVLHSDKHKSLAYEAASKGIVLLKNDGSSLPLDVRSTKKIAIIGPNAAFARVGGGGSSKVTPSYSVSPLQALEERIGDKVELLYSPGTTIKNDIQVIENSFFEGDVHAEYYKNISLEGEPLFQRNDREINFLWYYDAPRMDLHGDDDTNYFSVRWTGNIEAQATGDHLFTVMHNDGIRLWVDKKLVLDNWKDSRASFIDSAKVFLEKGKSHSFKLEYYNNGNVSEIKLGWEIPGVDLIKEATQLASEADLAIVFAGLSDHFEGEGRDRNFLVLENQDKLIKEVVRANPNTIVVLISGTPPIIESWAEQVPAIVQAWFGGQEAGNAIADILLGKTNPQGKLPCSFYKKKEDSPGFDDYRDESLNSKYSEGIYVGYRYLEKFDIKPRFPFGHGLSYTTFKYNSIRTILNEEGVQLLVNISNAGKIQGTETLQVYVDMPDELIDNPKKQLKGFSKVKLHPGESKQITINLEANAFNYYNEEIHEWEKLKGVHHILVGSSSADIRLKEAVVLK